MSRLIPTLGVLLLVASLLVGCNGAPASKAEVSNPSGAFPMTLTDDAGRSVTFQKAPESIVSLGPSNTEMLFALGLAGKIVAVDDYSDFPLEAKNKEKVGSFSKPNMEKLVSLSPGIIFGTNIHVKEVAPELEKRGLTIFIFQPGKVDAVLDSMRTIGKIMGKSKEAETVTAQLQKRIDAVVEKTRTSKEKPRVFFELDESLITAGPGTFVNDLVVKSGGSNIAADAKTAWPQLGQETILAKNPEVIILADHMFGVTPEKVKARPGWSEISAVKSGRIVGINPDLTNRPGPRVAEGLELIAKALHPELFK